MKKLAEIQQKLKAPKSQYNAFGKYKYRSCEDILEAVKPLLGDYSIIITDDIAMLGDRYYVKATAELFNSEGKVVAKSFAFAREEETKKGMDASQITGATSSYARKYALNGLLLIDDTKDADTTNKHEQDEPATKKPPKAKPKASTFQQTMETIRKEIGDEPFMECLGVHGFTSVDEITERKDQTEIYKELVAYKKTLTA